MILTRSYNLCVVNDWMTGAFDGLFKDSIPIVPLKVDGGEGCGYGRLIQLSEKISLSDAISRIKSHFKLPHGKL